ncbi:MAG: hypothetical protein CVT69_02080, partial [Actinobacteria bacterium HGW-Actinobacteria-9]
MRLGNECRDRHADTDRAPLVGRSGGASGLEDLADQFSDAADVLVRLRGQPHHEVELHPVPPFRERGTERVLEILFAHSLV